MEPDRGLPDLASKKQPCSFPKEWLVHSVTCIKTRKLCLAIRRQIDQTGLKVSSAMHPRVLYHYFSAKAAD